MLAFGLSALGEPQTADQKWLEAVQKIVTKGDGKVSTPNEVRVNLLKDWAGKNGYAVKVTKTDASYTVQITKTLAQK